MWYDNEGKQTRLCRLRAIPRRIVRLFDAVQSEKLEHEGYEMKNYCLTCMEEITQGNVCQRCRKPNEPMQIAHHLAPGSVLNNKYLVGNALGEGGFGITYIGRDLTLDLKVAIKEFFPVGYVNRNSNVDNAVVLSTEKQRQFYEKGKERFLQEARSLAKFTNETGVVQVRDYFEYAGSAYIVMEYLDGVTLKEFLKQNGTIDAETAFVMMLPIIVSLEKIHAAHNIIHRDISPDNIMYLRNGTLKLMDFGAARHYSASQNEMSVMIKEGYAPEEQYRKDGRQGPWTDVYGLCATIYRCITGRTPEGSLNRLRTDNLKKPSELGVMIAPDLEAILMYGLAVSQDDRCHDMTQLKTLVIKALNHERVEIAPPLAPDNMQSAEATGLYSRYGAAGAYYPNREERPTYGDAYAGGRQTPQPVADPVGGKKKSAAPIIITIIIVVLLVIGVGVLAYFVFFDNQPSGSSDTLPASDTVTQTNAVTEQATAVSVPNVIGMSMDKAMEELSKSGLKPVVEETNDDSHAANEVIGQYPAADAAADKGDEVTIYVAKGSSNPDSEKDEALKTETEAPTKATAESSSDEVVFYCRASDYATLRATPSRSGADLAHIGSREKVTYLGSEGEFYKVKYKGTEGYVLKDFFSSSPDAPLNYGSGNEKPEGDPGSTLYCRASDYVTLRATASISGTAIAKIHTGESVEYLSTAGEFIKVRYGGSTGYVLAKFFSADPNAPLNYDDK